MINQFGQRILKRKKGQRKMKSSRRMQKPQGKKNSDTGNTYLPKICIFLKNLTIIQLGYKDSEVITQSILLSQRRINYSVASGRFLLACC